MDSFKLLTRGSNLRKRPAHKIAAGEIKVDNETAKANTILTSRKRKLDEIEIIPEGDDLEVPGEVIRKLQKLHKIKFTDLRRLRQDSDGSRKAHKEASRRFPPTLQHFASLDRYYVNNALLSNLPEHGYQEPTGAQLATIPSLMSQGKDAPDLLTIAPTGSGKTLAFLVPLIDKVSKLHRDESDPARNRHVNSIILAPSRELRDQIVNEGRKLCARTGVRITAFKKGMRLHGHLQSQTQNDSGVSEGEEDVNDAIVVKADIIVSTPSRILHAIIPPGSSSPLSLPDVYTLILDEADVLLGPLFRSETVAVWKACNSPALQCSFWSATIGSSIEDLFIDTIESRNKSLKIKAKNQRPLLRCVIGLKDSSLPNINHRLIFGGAEHGKLIGLRDLMRPPTAPLDMPFLIFTQTIARAQALYSEIQYDYPLSKDPDMPPRIAVLHSDLPDSQRSKVLQNFRLGKTWFLITTDLLSRGIDFHGVGTVINYDIPTTSAVYVHRAGRTGRAGHEGGTCVTFWTKEDFQYLPLIVNVITKTYKLHGKGEIPEEMVPKFLLEQLPHLSKKGKKEIRDRGVEVRRSIKDSDTKQERRNKGRNTIGTESGYSKRLADRRKGMIEGSKRQKIKEKDEQLEDVGGDDFAGFE